MQETVSIEKLQLAIQIMDEFEAQRLDIAVRTRPFIEQIETLLETRYKQPHTKHNAKQLTSRIKTPQGHVLVSFAPQRNKSNFHAEVTYRLRFLDYNKHSTGKQKRIRSSLTDRQKAQGDLHNYHIKIDDNGLPKMSELQSSMQHWELDLYKEMLAELQLLFGTYRSLIQFYSDTRDKERTILRRFCITENIDVPNRGQAGLEMLQDSIKDLYETIGEHHDEPEQQLQY
ncbi:hypothetical protein [Vibrio owensii]|uniref:hypothetical protein n=1 Tax=Vibrio owensii TaxID=696485 RepID=UPI0040698B1A